MLDGNAIAGTMTEVFGADMTLTVAACASCGAAGMLAETAVYLRAPGVVVRCRRCDGVLLVVVERDGLFCVDMQGVASLGRA
jgi:uncharacterized protein DUF6510